MGFTRTFPLLRRESSKETQKAASLGSLNAHSRKTSNPSVHSSVPLGVTGRAAYTRHHSSLHHSAAQYRTGQTPVVSLHTFPVFFCLCFRVGVASRSTMHNEQCKMFDAQCAPGRCSSAHASRLILTENHPTGTPLCFRAFNAMRDVPPIPWSISEKIRNERQYVIVVCGTSRWVVCVGSMQRLQKEVIWSARSSF